MCDSILIRWLLDICNDNFILLVLLAQNPFDGSSTRYLDAP